MERRQKMIIDAHVHICPDKIAKASAKVFKERNKFSWFYDGTLGTFLKEAEKNGISKGIAVNVVVNPVFNSKANDFTASMVEKYPDKLIGYIFIHPGNENPAAEVERCVKTYGFKAIKINGSLHRFFPADERMLSVYQRAMELGVMVLTHCGPNVENFYKSPKEINERQFAEPRSWIPILERYPDLKIILAHFVGSTHYYDEALEVLERFPHVYTDTAMVLNKLTSEEATSFVKKIGAERVIFGTDYPGHECHHEIELVKKLDLTDEEKEMIFSKNITRLLELDH
jgi:predicted TIM-barrel fold metal-dependent hydrolase